MKEPDFQFSKNFDAESRQSTRTDHADHAADFELLMSSASDKTYDISLSDAEAIYEAFYKNPISQTTINK